MQSSLLLYSYSFGVLSLPCNNFSKFTPEYQNILAKSIKTMIKYTEITIIYKEQNFRSADHGNHSRHGDLRFITPYIYISIIAIVDIVVIVYFILIYIHSYSASVFNPCHIYIYICMERG